MPLSSLSQTLKRVARRRGAQQLDLLRGVHHQLEAGGAAASSCSRSNTPSRSTVRLLDAGLAQREPLIDPRDREGIRGCQRARDRRPAHARRRSP